MLAAVRRQWSTLPGRCRLLVIPGFTLALFIEAPRALERPVFGVGVLVFAIVGAVCCAAWLTSDSAVLAEVLLFAMHVPATATTHADILTDPDLAQSPWSVIVFLSIGVLHVLINESVGAKYAREFFLGEIAAALLSAAWIAKKYGFNTFSSWGMLDSLATNLLALFVIALFFAVEELGLKTFVVGHARNLVERVPGAGRDFLPVVPGAAQEGIEDLEHRRRSVEDGPGPDAAARARGAAEVRRGGQVEQEGVEDGLGAVAAARAAADVRRVSEEMGLDLVIFGRPLAAAAA